MKRIRTLLAIAGLALLLPNSVTSQCGWGPDMCVTEPCRWDCMTLDYGDWTGTCHTWEVHGTYYCCICDSRTIRCICLVGFDQGIERRRRYIADAYCVNVQQGDCASGSPPP